MSPSQRSYALGEQVITLKGGPVEAFDVLRGVEKRDGGITKKAVAKEARRLHKRLGSRSPLDAFFTWDTTAGMQKLHEIEAGELIRVYVLSIDEETEVRAFVSVEAGDSREYRYAEDIAAAPSFAEAHKEVLRRRLEAMAKELERWGLWVDVVQAIRRTLAS